MKKTTFCRESRQVYPSKKSLTKVLINHQKAVDEKVGLGFGYLRPSLGNGRDSSAVNRQSTALFSGSAAVRDDFVQRGRQAHASLLAPAAVLVDFLQSRDA